MLHYFPVQGRAEPVRLCMAYLGLKWREPELTFGRLESDVDEFPFGQCPSLSSNTLKVAQSMAILRHLGRMYGLYGSTLQEAAAIDMVLEGVEELRDKFKQVCKFDKPNQMCSLGERWTYADQVLRPTNTSNHHGVTLVSLERYMAEATEAQYSSAPSSAAPVQAPTTSGFIVGRRVSIADFAVANIVDQHLTMFPRETSQLPLLCAHHQHICSLPAVWSYLQGPQRPQDIWVVDWLARKGKDVDLEMMVKMMPQLVECS